MGTNFGVAFSPWSLQPCLVSSTLGHVLLSLPREGVGAARPFPSHQPLLPCLFPAPSPSKV